MPATAQITRFAPSPTGALHLGNARTALFSWLAARASGGRFVLRVEDTDAGRSQDALLERQLDELRWLGITWDEGPGVGGPHGPYRQSERGSIYAEALAKLEANDQTYPCFCSPEELQLSRKTQLAAGRPPRYARTCAGLSAAEVQRRMDSGKAPAIRFRVPDHRTVEFVDRVHGPQRFRSDDIGDFVIRRADGSVAFFLGNAVDDSVMGITLVLRGDDHLANTPRQLLLLEALGMPLPAYGHLPLVLAP
ncbi:MAG: glutamate--tRNA ligase family protein, partial [Proteobacteria bacterium]|nr:glutamate--tRNA ligase family protein [Pseudomonadota bacterium]